MQSEQRFPGNETSGTLVDLTPGEVFYIRLRAYNLGGLSEPTNVVQYTSEDDGEFVISVLCPFTNIGECMHSTLMIMSTTLESR